MSNELFTSLSHLHPTQLKLLAIRLHLFDQMHPESTPQHASLQLAQTIARRGLGKKAQEVMSSFVNFRADGIPDPQKESALLERMLHLPESELRAAATRLEVDGYVGEKASAVEIAMDLVLLHRTATGKLEAALE